MICTAARLALIVFLACGLPAIAATYHIDPAKGADDGDGSAAKPWKTLEQAAKTNFGQLKGGDTVLLASGYHGDVTFSGNNDSLVTIAAAEGAKPQLARLTIRQGTNWLVKGLIISPSFSEATYKGYMATLGENGESSKITIEDCYLFTEEDSSNWDVQKWMDAASGILLGRNGRELTARNNYLRNVRFGITMTSYDSLAEGNVVENFSADAMRMTRDGQTAQYNLLKNIYVSDADGDKNHDDGIQCFLFNKGKGELKNLTMVGNIIIAHEDPNQKFKNTLQGIGLFDGPLLNFKVTDNVLDVDSYHGISLYDAQNALIENNVVWTSTPGKIKAWIMFNTKHKDDNQSKDNIARNNFANKFSFQKQGTTAEKNETVTPEIFKKSYAKALKTINDKFGEKHPAADRPRAGK